jgi:RimJ/RimL family protein N-acetyltransferase
MIETQRLRLRRIQPDDVEEFIALHADPAVTEFVRPLDRVAAEDRLRKDEEEWRQRGHGIFAISDLSTGVFLGRTGPKYWPQFDETEVGWILKRSAWGQGYATEAARACIDWAFENLDVPYLTSMINPANARSVHVAKRLGLTPARDDVLLGDPVQVYKADRPQSSS